MSFDRQRWFAHLPIADERELTDIVLDGCLIMGDKETVRILVGRLCLTFQRADVRAVDEIQDCECGGSGSSAIHVRLVIKRGAALLDATPSEVHADRIRGRAPFALSTRPPVITTPPMPRYRALERQFMEAEGYREDYRQR